MHDEEQIKPLISTRLLAVLVCAIHYMGQQIDLFTPTGSLFAICISFLFTQAGFELALLNSPIRGSFIKHISTGLRKVYPLYLVALLSIALFIFATTGILQWDALLTQSLLIQSMYTNHATAYNSLGWVVSAAFIFYLLLPFLHSLFKKCGLLISFTLCLAAWGTTLVAGEYWLTNSTNFVYHSFFTHFNEFLWGLFLGMLYSSMPKETYKKNYTWEILALLAALPLLTHFEMKAGFRIGFLCIVFCPLLLLLSFDTGPITKFLKASPLIGLGQASYPIFIFQIPILLFAKAALGSVDNEVHLIVSIISLVLISLGVHLLSKTSHKTN